MTTPRTDDSVPHPEWAQTQTPPYAAPMVPEPAATQPAPHTAPALNPPTWSGRKTAVAAALAIGISSMGAVAAAAALPAGTTQGDRFQQGGFDPGGPQQGGFTGPDLPLRWVGWRARAGHTAYPSAARPVPRKDFSVVPVCGSVRPSASQRQLAQQP